MNEYTFSRHFNCFSTCENVQSLIRPFFFVVPLAQNLKIRLSAEGLITSHTDTADHHRYVYIVHKRTEWQRTTSGPYPASLRAVCERKVKHLIETSSFADWTSNPITFTPRPINSTTVAAPMPAPAPVTTAFRPFHCSMPAAAALLTVRVLACVRHVFIIYKSLQWFKALNLTN